MSGLLKAPQLGSRDECDILGAPAMNDHCLGRRDCLVADGREICPGMTVGRFGWHSYSRTGKLYQSSGGTAGSG